MRWAAPAESLHRGEGGLWIAKFPMLGDRFERSVWEKTALDLADACGVTVPPRRLMDLGARRVLVIQRFDRDGESRVPYISGRTLIQDTSEMESGDYVDVAASLRAEGTRPVADLRALFRQALVVALVNDTDNHLRNVGFLRSGSGWVLAPAFDINPNRNAGAPRATAIAGSRYPANTGAGLFALARSCGISRPEAQAMIEESLEVVGRWRDVAEANGAPGREIERFAEAFEVPAEAVRAELTR